MGFSDTVVLCMFQKDETQGHMLREILKFRGCLDIVLTLTQSLQIRLGWCAGLLSRGASAVTRRMFLWKYFRHIPLTNLLWSHAFRIRQESVSDAGLDALLLGLSFLRKL